MLRTARRRHSARTRRRGPARRPCPPAPAARLLPLLVARQLYVAEHLPRQLVGALRVRVRQRHRHVQIGRPSREAGVEDRLVEARIAGVQDRVRAHPLDQLDERLAIGGVHALGGEAIGLAQAVQRHRAPRSSETSASATCSKAGRRCAIAANAAPTPPAPTTRTRMGDSVRKSAVRNVRRRPRGYAAKAHSAHVCCPDPRGPRSTADERRRALRTTPAACSTRPTRPALNSPSPAR